MLKLTKQNLVAAIIVLAFSFVALALPAKAYEDGEIKTEDTKTTEQKVKEERATLIKEKATQRQEAAKAKLDATKLRVCQAREKAINTIMQRMATRGQKHLDLYTAVAERTQKFYEAKGKVLSNYDQLVADVNAKKATAQAAVDTLKSKVVTFKCDGEDPKGAAQSFKDGQKAEVAALKAYRTSVKNLIVGVKSVQTTIGDNNESTQ